MQEEKNKEEHAATDGAPPPAATPTPAPAKHGKELHELHERVKVLEGEKKSLETKLEGFLSLSKDERERSEVIAAEKKTRAQVCVVCVLHMPVCHVMVM